METFETLAFGIDLRLALPSEGGRTTPIVTDEVRLADFQYRPNWRLPGTVPPEQTAAPILRFSSDSVSPGDRVWAVILVPYPITVEDWDLKVGFGTDLPMYEGSRVCGVGTVAWKTHTTLPLDDLERARLSAWLEEQR